jgi:hypothetical protein
VYEHVCDEESSVLLAASVSVRQAFRIVVGLPLSGTEAVSGRIAEGLPPSLANLLYLLRHVIAPRLSVAEVVLQVLEACEHPADHERATSRLVSGG